MYDNQSYLHHSEYFLRISCHNLTYKIIKVLQFIITIYFTFNGNLGIIDQQCSVFSNRVCK